MKTGRFLGAGFAYLAITFALGYVWHLVLFRELYARLAIFTRLDDPIVPLGLGAMVIQGGVLAYLYPSIARSGSPWREGVRFGVLTGLFIASSAVLAEAAKQRVSSLSTWLTVESAYYALQFVASGVAIAWIHGRRADGA